jgi:hypothetical protein
MATACMSSRVNFLTGFHIRRLVLISSATSLFMLLIRGLAARWRIRSSRPPPDVLGVDAIELTREPYYSIWKMEILGVSLPSQYR